MNQNEIYSFLYDHYEDNSPLGDACAHLIHLPRVRQLDEREELNDYIEYLKLNHEELAYGLTKVQEQLLQYSE